jgi:hypothetical protein
VEIKGICFGRVSGMTIEGFEEGRRELYMSYYILDNLVLDLAWRLYLANFSLNSLTTSLSTSCGRYVFKWGLYFSIIYFKYLSIRKLNSIFEASYSGRRGVIVFEILRFICPFATCTNAP